MDGDFSYEMEFCFHEPMSRNQFGKSGVVYLTDLMIWT